MTELLLFGPVTLNNNIAFFRTEVLFAFGGMVVASFQCRMIFFLDSIR
jgi:hypothetical protein